MDVCRPLEKTTLWIASCSPSSSRISMSLSSPFQCSCFIHSPMPDTSKLISLVTFQLTISRLLSQWYHWRYHLDVGTLTSKSSELCVFLALFDFSVESDAKPFHFFLKLPLSFMPFSTDCLISFLVIFSSCLSSSWPSCNDVSWVISKVLSLTSSSYSIWSPQEKITHSFDVKHPSYAR